jgi:hypothetical protein
LYDACLEGKSIKEPVYVPPMLQVTDELKCRIRGGCPSA